MTPRRLLIAALLAAIVAAPVDVRAQAAGSAQARFTDASAKEAAVRKVLDAPSSQPTVLKAVREVVADFENLVRRYPASGYCDDALWRAGILSKDAFDKFHDAREHAAALRLLKALPTRYPTSKFVKSVPAQLSALNASASLAKTVPDAPPAPAAPAVARLPTPEAPAAPLATAESTSAAPAAKVTTIKEIRRAVLPDAVRIVIELDGAVSFHDERLENPARVFVDLPATRAAPALQDQTIRFDTDADLVRQVRIGRHPNSTTRVVLDTSGISSYSVYPLYSPFRLVIDCLKAKPGSGTIARGPAPMPPDTPRPAASPAAAAVAAAIPSRGLPAVKVPAVQPRDLLPVLTARRSMPMVKVPNVRPTAAATLRAAAETNLLPKPTADAVARVEEPHAPVGTVSVAQLPAPKVGEPSRTIAGGYSIARQLGLSVSRIVIDPGHGGHDPGAKSGSATEADLVLDIALKLEAQLAKLPGVEVVLTRRTDTFVSLQERTAIANRESADLFLSIHANASNSAQARGVETYFLNFATTQTAAAVAARENAASGQAMNELPDVIKAIALNNKRDESRDFATYVQREMVGKLRPANKLLKDLGVKQAPFVVLIGAAMPSALAEVSFLTNPQDARLLKSTQYRQRIANALFDAVRKYQAALKNTTPATGQN